MLPAEVARRVARSVRFVVIACAVWVAAIVVVALFHGNDIGRSWAAVGWPVVAATSIVFVVNHAIRFARWHWMLCALGMSVPVLRSLAIFMAGLAFLPTPGKVGVAVRSVMLVRMNVPVRVSLAAYFGERMFDLAGLLLLAGLFYRGPFSAQVEAAAWLALVLVLALVHFHKPLLQVARHMVGASRTLAAGVDGLSGLLENAELLFGGWRALCFLVAGVAANASLAVLITTIGQWLSAAVPTSSALGYVAISHLSGTMSMLPGGLGSFEFVFLASLDQSHVAPAAALVMLACIRFVTLWGPVAVGLPLLALMLRPENAPA